MTPIYVGVGTADSEVRNTTLGLPLLPADPSSPQAGDVYFNTDDNVVKYYNGTSWEKTESSGGGGGGAGGGGGSSGDPITDFSAWKVGKTTANDGKYWVKLASGTNTAFETYITLRNGGWMKVAQMWSDYNVITGGGGAADNAQQAGGAWINNEINTSGYGKLHSSDIDAMDKSAYLMRVTGNPSGNSSDPFLNNGSGTMKFEYMGNRTLPNWGTHQRPTGEHKISVDANSNGEYDYACQYVADGRNLCRDDGNHGGNNGSAWTTDHNYYGEWLGQSGGGVEQCYTFTPSRIHVNLHGFGGGAGSSGSNKQWGGNSYNAVSWWMRPTLNSASYDSTLPSGTVFACNGDSFTDDSVYGHTISTANGAAINTSTKKTGTGSIRVQSGNDCFFVKDQVFLDDDKSSWQFQCWVYMSSVSSGNVECIIDQYKSGANNGGQTSDTGRFLFGPQNSKIIAREGGTIWLQGTTTVSTNTWYHIMLNWDGSTHRLFVNGNLEDSGNNPGGNGGHIMKHCRTMFGGGTHLSGYDLNGYMDHICVQWNSPVKTSNFTPNGSGYTT